MKPLAGDRVVAGSIESVSASTQNSLRELGLSVVVTSQGEDVRIASSTPEGTHFAFVLTREKSAAGERTRVHLEWEKSAEGKVGQKIQQVMAALEVEAGKPVADGDRQ